MSTALQHRRHAALVVIGAGSHGVEEMHDLLDESKVSWAMIRFELGSGAFRRHKLVFLHFNGDDCPPMKRGQANALTAEAQRLLRAHNTKGDGFHASLSLTRKAEVTTEHIIARVGRFFIADYGDVSVQMRYSLATPRAAWAVSRKAETPRKQRISGGCDEPRPKQDEESRSEASFEAGRDALKAVAESGGPWNWALLRSEPGELPVVAGGDGSVDEMQQFLRSNQGDVLCGLLRLGVGVGRLRRTKHVFIHSIGQQTSTVSRGRLAARRPQMEQAIGKFTFCSASLEVTRAEDLTLEEIKKRVRGSSHVDDEVLDGDRPPPRSSPKPEAADAESQGEDAAADSHQDPQEQAARGRLHIQGKSVEEVAALLHSQDGPLNWALFAPNPAILAPRPSVASRARLAARRECESQGQ